MNSNKICLNCGSTDIVSDRSLGGRMICSKCGSYSFKSKSFYPRVKNKYIYLVVALIIFLIVII